MDLPSAQLSDEEDKKMQRNLAGLSALQAVSQGLNNMAGTLKPGSGGDVSGIFKGYRDEAMGPVADRQLKRKEAIENFDQDLKGRDETRKEADDIETRGQKQAASQKLKDYLTPGSPTAQRKAQEAADKYRMLSAAQGIPQELQAMFTERANPEAHKSKSASDLDDEMKRMDGSFGDIVKSQTVKNESDARTAQLRATGTGQSETHRHNVAEEGLAGQRALGEQGKELKAQVNEDKKAEDEIKNLEMAANQIEPMQKGVESGDIDTSGTHRIANTARKALAGFSPGLAGALGIHPDAKLQEMETKLPLVQGGVEQAVTHSSRYSPARWAEVTPHPGDGPEVTAAKLKAQKDLFREVADEKKGLLHTNADGSPKSTSAMVRALPPGDLPAAANKSQEQTAGGEHAVAIGWARAHPQDPRSALILKKNGLAR